MSEQIELLRDRLPAVGTRRLAVRATPDALRQIRGGSPWLYDGSITSVSHDGAPGDLAVVFDDDRKFRAVGLWDPNSPITLKILHSGSPATIDAAWFRDRLSAAVGKRDDLANDESTTAYRCVHGENDGLPGLIIDRYTNTLVVKLYTAAWFPHLVPVLEAMLEITGVDRVVLRLARLVSAGETFGLSDGDTLFGEVPTGPVRFRERGLAMEADVLKGQKTGHFLDQRDNRALVRGMAEGCEVLDVFASTGGFSLAAAAGGAKAVHLVDNSAQALATAERNLANNRRIGEVRRCTVRVSAGDAFQVMARLASNDFLFDIVIIDPPSFAQSQANVAGALNSYARLTRAGLKLLKPGGMLVQSSCSSRVSADLFFQTVIDAADFAGYKMREVRRTGHAVDHPIGFEFGAYLKTLFARIG